MISAGFDNVIYRFPVRIYYEDTDLGGVVYHANYLKYYERARTEMLGALNVCQTVLFSQGMGFVIKHIVIDNKAPARFNDDLVVKTKIKHLKKASVEFTQWIELDGKPINTCEITVVSVLLASMKPVRIPETIYEELERVC